MAITRKVNNKVDIKPWEAIISHIDLAFDDIHRVFSQAFSGGQANPEGVDAKKKALFDVIWEGLSGLDIATHASIDELNKYYLAYINNLDHFINDYCRTENLSDDMVSQNNMDILTEVAKIYYALIKQKYILNLFRQGDESKVMLSLLAIVNKESIDLQKDFQSIDLDVIEKNLVTINVIFNEIIEGLRLKGFGQIDADSSLVELPKSHQNDLSKIREELNHIPPANETIDVIHRLSDAQHHQNTAEMNACRNKLKKIAIDTDGVIQRLGSIVSEDLKAQARNLYTLLQQCSEMDKKLLELNDHFEKVDIFPLVIQIYGYKDNYLDTSNGSGALFQLAKTMESLCGKSLVIETGLRINHNKLFSNAKDTVNDHLPKIAKELGEFIQPYVRHFKTYQDLSLRMDKLNDKKNKMNTMRMSWASRLKKAEDAWQKCCEAMYSAQDVLFKHAESTFDFIKAFLLRHKLKMVAGGVGGTGTGVTLSGLLFAFELTATGVFVGSGTVLGVAVAALVGLGIDHFRQSKPGNEDKPLSRIDRVRVNKSIFAGMTFDENMVAEPEAVVDDYKFSWMNEETKKVDVDESQPSKMPALPPGSSSMWSRVLPVDKLPSITQPTHYSGFDAPKLNK